MKKITNLFTQVIHEIILFASNHEELIINDETCYGEYQACEYELFESKVNLVEVDHDKSLHQSFNNLRHIFNQIDRCLKEVDHCFKGLSSVTPVCDKPTEIQFETETYLFPSSLQIIMDILEHICYELSLCLTQIEQLLKTHNQDVLIDQLE